MKKFLVALGLATVLSMPSVSAYTFYVEPESDTAVSFNVYDVLDGKWETTFVNYANSNGDDEYWIRVATATETKLLILHIWTITAISILLTGRQKNTSAIIVSNLAKKNIRSHVLKMLYQRGLKKWIIETSWKSVEN